METDLTLSIIIDALGFEEVIDVALLSIDKSMSAELRWISIDKQKR